MLKSKYYCDNHKCSIEIPLDKIRFVTVTYGTGEIFEMHFCGIICRSEFFKFVVSND